MPDLNMKGKNSDRALVHLDASIYFYLKWGWKWAIAGCKATLGVHGIPPSVRHGLVFQFMCLTYTIDQYRKGCKCKIARIYLWDQPEAVKRNQCESCKLSFWEPGPPSDRRTIKGRTVFEIKVVFAVRTQAISNKTSAVEKWLDKIKQWTLIVVQ